MTHLAAGSGLGLAVKVQAGVRFGGEGPPLFHLVAQQIGHLDMGVCGGRAAVAGAVDGMP